MVYAGNIDERVEPTEFGADPFEGTGNGLRIGQVHSHRDPARVFGEPRLAQVQKGNVVAGLRESMHHRATDAAGRTCDRRGAHLIAPARRKTGGRSWSG